MKKYELTEETMEYCGYTLHRIRALKDFGSVKKGSLGGWIEGEENLSQEGDAWVADEAKVYALGLVRDNGQVFDNVEIYGEAVVRDNAKASGDVILSAFFELCENEEVSGHEWFLGC